MKTKKIDSLNNPTLRQALRLQNRRERLDRQQFAVEGLRENSRILASGFALDSLFFCPQLISSKGQNFLRETQAQQAVTFYELSERAFHKLVIRKGAEGVYGVYHQKKHQLQDLSASQEVLLLLLNGIEKPGNVGALLRTADAVGAHAVILVDSPVDIYNPNTIRASLGCFYHKPIISTTSSEIHNYCSRNSITIYSAIPGQKSQSYLEKNYSSRSAVLLGSEDRGVDSYWLKNIDHPICIPMHGIADSLNVSVAGAVILYEVFRQRSLS